MTVVNTEGYTASAAQAREATEKSVESWKRNVRTFTDQAGLVTRLPRVELTEPVTQYFQLLQQFVDANRELATRWAEIVDSLTGTVREQAEKVSGAVVDQVDAVADVATDQARKAEELANEQAEQAEQAAKEQEREVKRAERAAAKQAREQAREPYEGLTKAELSDQLAERGLPKTGTVEELIERLVGSDNSDSSDSE
jgi:hypothetical protein